MLKKQSHAGFEIYAPSPNVCTSEMYGPFLAPKMYAPVGIFEKNNFLSGGPFPLETNPLPFYLEKMPI